VSGDVHTQTIEGFFSNLKRGIAGNYHSVSSKWLQGLPERVRLALQRARQRAGYVPFAGRSCCRVLRRGIRTVDVAEGWDPRIIGLRRLRLRLNRRLCWASRLTVRHSDLNDGPLPTRPTTREPCMGGIWLFLS
jgi:hypothetical protein